MYILAAVLLAMPLVLVVIDLVVPRGAVGERRRPMS